jgi:N-acetylglucosamine-6-phosphate deacetylase
VIAWARKRGITAAIGHSAASPDMVARAAEAGATLSVHLGNGLAALQPKFANPMMAQLGDDRLSASFIADGIHIPPHALRVMVRAKGQARGILVTDATAAAAAAPGRHAFAGMAIERAQDGSVRLPGRSTLAGSALTLDDAVRNVVAWGIAAPAQALRMASANPLSVLAAALETHGIGLQPSEVEWSPDLHPHSVRVGGTRVSPAFA